MSFSAISKRKGRTNSALAFAACSKQAVDLQGKLPESANTKKCLFSVRGNFL
jgi:hypothetical protein